MTLTPKQVKMLKQLLNRVMLTHAEGTEEYDVAFALLYSILESGQSLDEER